MIWSNATNMHDRPGKTTPDEALSARRFHVLLVGIDAYTAIDGPRGCSNDADAIESLLVDHLSVPQNAITKLVARRSSLALKTDSFASLPTEKNLRAALEKLTTEEVRPGDTVFIFYSGHGTQVFSRMMGTNHEALVPMDVRDGGENIFDYELNDILHRISLRTNDLTVILDCCCSAGITRSVNVPKAGNIRYCELDAPQPSVVSRQTRGGRRIGLFSALDPSDPGFLVVAAAQSGEAANECVNARGVCHGAFTAALLDILCKMTPDELWRLRWVDIWQLLRSRVTLAFPGQQPCLMGRNERHVFGGPFHREDAGFTMTKEEDGVRIHAGTLAGLDVGALVGVYGPEPAFFPTLHSNEDTRARIGELRVERASTSMAFARLVRGRFPGDMRMRGRLIKPSNADSLVVLLQFEDPDLARYLEKEAHVVVVDPSNMQRQFVEAYIGLSEDNHWFLGDDIFGKEAPLARIRVGDRWGLARALMHYARYNLPSRLVRRSRDYPGALRIEVLDAREVSMLQRDELKNPFLPPAAADGENRSWYCLKDGDPVCFVVENRSSVPLYVHLFNCASSGKVEILGPTHLEVPAKQAQTFWRNMHLGRVFPCSLSRGRRANLDRLVAIGTRSASIDLKYLEVSESFVQAIDSAPRGTRGDCEPLDEWTASSVVVRIVQRT